MQVLNILNMPFTIRFFSSKCSLFHNANLFGSCIIHILYTGCAEIKKNNSGAKGLTVGAVLSVATAPYAVMECRRTSSSLYPYLYHYNCVSVIGCLHKQLRGREREREREREGLMYLAHFTLTLSTLRHNHRRFLIADSLIT